MAGRVVHFEVPFSDGDRARAFYAEAFGVPEERVRVVYNGVDAKLFSPGDRDAARARLGLPPGEAIVLLWMDGSMVGTGGVTVQ